MMGGLIKLFNEWEIQLLVLLSFTLQLFLLFAGNLRRHSSSGFVRLLIWLAFLGADLVAVYALGLLSRQENNINTIIERGSQPLAFFWAPFLLIHLGGQDTITAFSMEDNNLWPRHLLNLVVQVVLAFYVFSRSIRRLHCMQLIVSGVLVFVAGIIKYGERTWCLWHGSLEVLESSTRADPFFIGSVDVDNGSYSKALWVALISMPYVLRIFSGRGYCSTTVYPSEINEIVKIGRFQLGLAYDEFYTKAALLRSTWVMTFRHISQISIVVAFVLFHIFLDKQRYAKADIAITYSLFIGGFFIEVCSMLLTSKTMPWTWFMLKNRKWQRLAGLSWFIFSRDIIGRPKKKQGCPSSIGQYNHLSCCDGTRGTRFSQQVMTVVIRVYDYIDPNKYIFWMSKLLDTWYEDADEMTMACVAEEIIVLHGEGRRLGPREWPNIGLILEMMVQESKIQDFERCFGELVVNMHILTGLFLSKYSDMIATTATQDDDGSMVRVCRKLSNYMMYLLVAHPSMLPLTTSSAGVLENLQSPLTVSSLEEKMDKYDLQLQQTKETLMELVYMWTRILLYAAGKCRPETHAAKLASTGGELITFAWLVMSFFELGDAQYRRISVKTDGNNSIESTVYAFNIILANKSEYAAGPSSSV